MTKPLLSAKYKIKLLVLFIHVFGMMRVLMYVSLQSKALYLVTSPLVHAMIAYVLSPH